MRTVLLCLCLCSWVLISGDLRAAEVYFPEALDVVQVDGVAYKRSIFAKGDTRLELSAGKHHVIVRFNQIFENGDQLDKVRSDDWRVELEVPVDARIALDLPEIKSSESAREFIAAPQLTATIEPVSAVVKWQLFTTAHLSAGNAAGIKELPSSNEESSEAAKQLRYWWPKANNAEQQQFLQEVAPNR